MVLDRANLLSRLFRSINSQALIYHLTIQRDFPNVRLEIERGHQHFKPIAAQYQIHFAIILLLSMDDGQVVRNRATRIQQRTQQLYDLIEQPYRATVNSKLDHQFSPWSSDQHAKSYAPRHKLLSDKYLARETTRSKRNNIDISSNEQDFRISKDFIQLIRQQKRRDLQKNSRLACRLNGLSDIKKIDLQLDEQLIYSPQKMYGDVDESYCEEGKRSVSRYESRLASKQEPTRIKIFKQLQQRRRKQADLEPCISKQSLRPTCENKISSYKAYHTVELKLKHQNLPKIDKQREYNKYNNLSVRKSRIYKEMNKSVDVSNHQIQANQDFELKCKGHICAKVDPYLKRRKAKLRHYAADAGKLSEDAGSFLE